MNTLKKGVLSFRHKAGNGYSITKTHYRTVPVCRGKPLIPGPILTLQWLSRAHNRTGISSPKPQFSKRVKSNFNLKVKPKGLITTHFFFLNAFFLIAFSAYIWTINEASEQNQKNTCAWRYFLQGHILQLIAPSPEAPQTAFTHGGNGKGRTISSLRHPMNPADT